jgi:hypothetical protein
MECEGGVNGRKYSYCKDCGNPILRTSSAYRGSELGIEEEISGQAAYGAVVFLVCGIEPLEGMFLVAEIGI